MSPVSEKSPLHLQPGAVMLAGFSLWEEYAAQDPADRCGSFPLLLGCDRASTVLCGRAGRPRDLSDELRSLLTPSSSAFSSYSPQTGPAVEVVFGRHLSDYFSLQGDYIWNHNGLMLTSVATTDGSQQGYQETRSTSQQSVIADLLVYFRRRNSRLRPYLSVGTGLVHLSSSQQQTTQLIGAPVLPPKKLQRQYDRSSCSSWD